jgi:transcriptional regulator with XRE-family HTH domain
MFEPLGEVVRLRRKQLDLTQEKVARMAKVSRRQLALLEDGRNVSLLFLTKIANALQISELPVGHLRVFSAPPELAALVRAAEAVQDLKQAGETWRHAAATIEASGTTLDELLTQAVAGPPVTKEAEAAAWLARLPAPAQEALAETLRMITGSETDGETPGDPAR